MTLRKQWLVALLLVLVGMLLGMTFSHTPQTTAQDKASSVTPHAAETIKTESPPHRALDANLYMQTAAEYRACCLQTYNFALWRLQENHKAAKAAKPDAKFAIIMDLDETVLDNAGFQAVQLRSGLGYSQLLWDGWETKHPDLVGLIPGSLEFIQVTEKLGITIVYISNRSDRFREYTKQALKHVGITLHGDDCLKLSTTTSNKTERRKEVEAKYTVLLNVGDNLPDFDEEFRCPKLDKRTPAELDAAIQTRKKAVDQHRTDWGTKWIILPNSAYGEWAKPLGMGLQDYDRLVPPIPKS